MQVNIPTKKQNLHSRMGGTDDSFFQTRSNSVPKSNITFPSPLHIFQTNKDALEKIQRAHTHR